MNDFLKVAVMLTAYDQMSRTVQEACSKSKQQIKDLSASARADFAKGFGLIGAGQEGFAMINKTIDAYATLQEGQLALQSVMADSSGQIANIALFNKLNEKAVELGNKLPGTTADFHALFATMIKSGANAEDIYKGAGAAAANLAIAIKMPYDEAGKLAVKLGNAAGVGSDQLLDFMDVVAKANQLGIDSSEMQYAFSKSAGALKSMDIQGLEKSKELTAAFAIAIRNGMSGETAGTAFSSILTAFTDSGKMSALNEQLQSLGVNMKFMDSGGNFLGIDNMFKQLDKIKGLDPTKQTEVLKAFTGATGGDANLMRIFLKDGYEGLAKMNKAFGDQAKLQDKVGIATSGLNSKKEAMWGTIENLTASIGARLAPHLSKLVDLISNCAAAIQGFLERNPELAEFIGLLAVAISTGLMLAGVILVVKGLITVFSILNMVLMMNPFILIAMAAIVAAMLIYVYWDKIKAFFSRLWDAIKNIFKRGWEFVKMAAYAFFNPVGFIRDNWDKIGPVFSMLWTKIKNIFIAGWEWFKNINVKFYEAGKNIVKSIGRGIADLAMWPVNKIAEMTTKMREYLPYSPAKQGAFKDLHKIKIIETIAASIKANPLVQAMRNAMQQTAGVTTRLSPAGGGGITLHYAPVINIGAGANKQDFMKMLNDHKEDILKMLNQAQANKSRTSFK